MLLRSISHHVKSQNWFAVTLDFIVVVAGILIAFQVTEWAETRTERQRERLLISDLLADIETDRAEYKTVIDVAVLRLSAANSSLVGAGLPPIEFDWRTASTGFVDYSPYAADYSSYSAELLDRLWSDVVLGYHPTLSTLSYESLVGSGDIGVVENRSIVREIQAYRTRAQGVVSQTDKLLSVREDVLRIGAAAGLAPYLEMPAEDFFSLVKDSPEIAAAIRIMATFAIFHLEDVQAADAKAAELQKLLRTYLKDRGGPVQLARDRSDDEKT